MSVVTLHSWRSIAGLVELVHMHCLLVHDLAKMPWNSWPVTVDMQEVDRQTMRISKKRNIRRVFMSDISTGRSGRRPVDCTTMSGTLLLRTPHFRFIQNPSMPAPRTGVRSFAGEGRYVGGSHVGNSLEYLSSTQFLHLQVQQLTSDNERSSGFRLPGIKSCPERLAHASRS